jgi:ADP-ribose pyrophosphatase YjhB (NUDIX family)
MTDENLQTAHGVITYSTAARRSDFLYRVSLKCLIRNEHGEVLVVKEKNRPTWDLPGGGMDHGEDITTAIAREMHEEVTMRGDFTYKIIAVEDPAHLQPHNLWQIRLVFAVTPKIIDFSPGDDGDEVSFMQPDAFKDSDAKSEQLVYKYSLLAQ